MNTNNLKAISSFRPLEGEATFPPTIQKEVARGAHIAVECITRSTATQDFVMVVWPNGLPRHETTRTVRFPHGLLRFGETMSQCAERLVSDQLGMDVDSVRIVGLDSYVDEHEHWHIEPILLATVSGDPKLPEEAESVVRFSSSSELPTGSLWSKDELSAFDI